MQNGNDIDTELRELSSRLAGLPRLTPYATPVPGYFEALAPCLVAGVRAGDLHDPAAGLSLSTPFEIPAGYFETLPLDLVAGVHLSQTAGAPFATPDGYLAQLPEHLMEAVRTAESQTASASRKPGVIHLLRQSASWMVAAAALAGLWFGLGRDAMPLTASQDPVAALSALPADSIGAYVERHVEEFDTESLEMALAGAHSPDFRSAVSGLRSDEIEDYLNDAAVDDGAPEDGI